MKYIFSKLVKLWKWELDLYLKYVNWVFKKVGLLVLLISFAFGQVGSLTDSDDMHTWLDFINPIELPQQDSAYCPASMIEREIIRYYEQQKLQEPITFGDILDYAEECYNDSIYKGDKYITGEWFNDDSTLSHRAYKEYRFDNETYYHLRQDNYLRIEKIYEPIKPTFEGFIEWLEFR